LLRRELAPREFAVRRGDPADALFLVVQGEVSVLAAGTDGQLHRLSTLSAGMGFGESALSGGGTRTASVRADTRSVCWVLDRAAYQALDGAAQAIRVKLLENLLRSSARIVARLTGEALGSDA
jgi:CRP-like cAMP-binding protein